MDMVDAEAVLQRSLIPISGVLSGQPKLRGGIQVTLYKKLRWIADGVTEDIAAAHRRTGYRDMIDAQVVFPRSLNSTTGVSSDKRKAKIAAVHR